MISTSDNTTSKDRLRMDLRSSLPLTSTRTNVDLKPLTSQFSQSSALVKSSLTTISKRRILTSDYLKLNLQNQALYNSSLLQCDLRSSIDTKPSLGSCLGAGKLTSLTSTSGSLKLSMSATTQQSSALLCKPAQAVQTAGLAKDAHKAKTSQASSAHSSTPGSTSTQLTSVKSEGRESAQTVTQPVNVKTQIEQDEIVHPDDDFIVPKYELKVEKDVEKFQLLMRDDAGEEKELVDDIGNDKRSFINAVSSSLINSPDFKKKSDPTRGALIQLADKIAEKDPEFILKVGLYTRRQLNIRTTANFLLTYASWRAECRPYLAKYFKHSVVLPSDWIEIAEQYAAFCDKQINFGSLPAALRKVLVAKFPDFDQYQLAKYNKEKSVKKRQKRQKQTEQQQSQQQRSGRGGGARGRGASVRGRWGARGRARGRGATPRGGASTRPEASAEKTRRFLALPDSDDEAWESDDGSEKKSPVIEKSFTLKQLIRKLHISEPVEHVMCLLGKRYPSNLDSFYQSRLPGTFDEAIAGKRMKLPTPMTWETQVSLHGNKATTWENLIDKRKLPFMAMLRNVRNVIRAGISRRHHKLVTNKLADENAVINSKQFPFRFFSAFEILDELEQEYEMNQLTLVAQAVNNANKKPVKKKFKKDTPWWQIRQARRKAKLVSEVAFDLPLLNQYRKALDAAVKIAVTHNVSPIKGRTVMLCNVGRSMAEPCHSGKSVGSKRTMLDIGLLLGLMCKQACEESELVVYGDVGASAPAHRSITPEKGTILDNMARLVQLAEVYSVPVSSTSAPLPEGYLLDVVRHGRQVDNLIVVSDDPVNTGESAAILDKFLTRYRSEVSAELLFVCVSLKASAQGSEKCKFSDVEPNNIFITGYSEQILRFIAERGEAGQMAHIEKIDRAFGLPEIPGAAPLPPESRLLPVVDVTPRWRTLRVFISSTFRDMHGERDLLTRFVFPELRALARKKLIHVSEVDLRWGVTSENRHGSSIESCLSELERCDMFVGMLGYRYGYVPDPYPQHFSQPSLKWLESYPKSALTELEFCHGLLSEHRCIQTENGFLYLREPVTVPSEFSAEFNELSPERLARVEQLRQKVAEYNHVSPKVYSARWGGVVEGKPVLCGLDKFGTMVLNDLWSRIADMPQPECGVLTELSHQNNLHRHFMEQEAGKFVARDKLLKELLAVNSTILVIHGPQGSGKTAVLAKLLQELSQTMMSQSREHYVITHFTGHVAGSEDVEVMLRRLTATMADEFDVERVLPENYKNLVCVFRDVITLVASQRLTRGWLLIGVDDLDGLETGDRQILDWLPEDLPKNVRLLVTCRTDGPAYRSLVRLQHVTMTSSLPKLSSLDRADMIRSVLAKYGKRLDESAFNNQLKLVTSKRESTSPLYLSLVCEEIRMLGLYEELGSRLRGLPHTVPALLQLVLARLEQEHGKPLLQTSLRLVYHAHAGLSESELQWLLGTDAGLDSNKCTLYDVIQSDRKLTAAIFFPLLRSLVGFLRCLDEESTVQVTMKNEEIRTAVVKRYINTSGSAAEIHAHKLLAGLYKRLCDPDNDHSYSGMNATALTQLTTHLILADCHEDYVSTVCDLRFIKAKCDMALTESLLYDFTQPELPLSVLSKIEAKLKHHPYMSTYREFVFSNNHIFKKNPGLVYQTALNAGGHLAEEAENYSSGMIRQINRRKDKTNPYLILDAFNAAVLCTAVTDDGKVVACGQSDGDIKLLDFNTGKIVRTLSGHSDRVTCVMFALGNILVSCSADTNVIIWDHAEGTRKHILKAHTRPVSSVSVSPDQRLVSSAGWDCCVRVWRLTDGKIISEHIKDSSPFNCVAFHPDAELIATGGWDGKIKIWSYVQANNARKAVLTGSSSVQSLCYSDNGRHLFSCSIDGAVTIWSSMDGKISSAIGHAAPVNQIVYNDKMLITCSDDWKTKVWQSTVGHPLYTSTPFPSLGGATCLNICPDGDHVVVGYHEGKCLLYSIKRGICLRETNVHDARVTAVKFEPSAPYNIYSTANDGKLLCCGRDGRLLVNLDHDYPLTSLALSRDGTMAAVAESRLYTVTVYYTHGTMLCVRLTLSGHTAMVTGMSFSTVDGQTATLLTASRDRTLVVWSLDDGSKLREIVAHDDWVNGCQVLSKDQNQILTCSNDFNLRVWDVSSGLATNTLTGHQAAVNSLAEAEGCVVSGSSDGVVKVWSYKGRDVTTLYGHNSRVNQCHVIALNQDCDKDVSLTALQGDWARQVASEEWDKEHEKKKFSSRTNRQLNVIAASCCEEGKFIVWKPLEFTHLNTLCGHSGRVVSVSTDKKRACTSALDNSVCLWSLEQNGNRDVYQHEANIQSLSVTESACLSASRDGVVKLWQCCGLTEYSKMPKLQFSLQAHDGCLTVASLSCDASRFATANADRDVTFWTVRQSDMDKSYYAECECTFSGALSAPAWSMAWLQGVLLLVGMDSGAVCLVHPSNGIQTTLDIFDHPIVELKAKPGDDHVIYARCTSGDVVEMTVTEGSRPVVQNKQTKAKKTTLSVTPVTYSMSYNVISDVTSSDVTFGGPPNVDTTLNQHYLPGTRCHGDHRVVIDDRNVRVVKERDDVSKQVGHFSAESPIKQVQIFPTKRTDDGFAFVCGDQLGNVLFLTWTP